MKKLSILVMSIIMSIALAGCGKTNFPVTLDDIKDASKVLQGIAVVTELKEAESLSKDGQKVFLKMESDQPINSFKIRGAFYMISKLTPKQLEKGLCTCSAGNHAQGVGLAADSLGCDATIYVPSSAPKMKIERIQSYKNVTLKIIEGSFDDAMKACVEDAETTGKIFVPPYDDEDVIAGQGTAGLEIMNQLPDVDAIVIPVGGGGLASGIAIAAKTINPDCRIYVVEPENAASMKASIEAGKPVELENADTIADGTAVKKPGDLTFDICSSLCDGFITVTEDEIRFAIAHLYSKEGVTAEGAGALSTAAVMTGKIPSDCKKVVCVVSGSNIDPELLEEIMFDAILDVQ